MPRPRKHRCCRAPCGDRLFKPRRVPLHALSLIPLGLDELEALRLCDLEERDQEEAGRHMGVSRGTVQRLLKSARRKVAGALCRPAALVIQDPDTIEKGEGRCHEDCHSNR
ncbi:MAG: DUF134 domain-containing protein [Candidatus Eisenbacteria bacterium]|nr:DUF134 domain-containing protein [Candidatus Latescibacterota bacterium]MBD3301006.1 DUF134 domain-containing protein [Candidatus Eisenbacteria bacterium]